MFKTLEKLRKCHEKYLEVHGPFFSGVVSPFIWVIIMVTPLITPLITNHEPPIRVFWGSGGGFRCLRDKRLSESPL